MVGDLMAGLADLFAESQLAKWLQAKAAAADGLRMDEAGFDPAFKMPEAPAAAVPAAASAPARMPDILGGKPIHWDAAPFDRIPGMLSGVFNGQSDAGKMMFDPEGRPIDPFYASTVGKPAGPAPDTWGKGAAPIPGIGAMAGLLSGVPGIEGAKAPQQWDSVAPFNDRPPTNDPSSFEPQILPTREVARAPGDPVEAAAGAPLSLNPSDYQDRLPANATPTEGVSRASAAVARGAPEEGGGFLDTLSGIGKKIFDPNKAATWMALGSGFAGAGSIGSGFSRAAAAAVPAMAADRAQSQKQQTIADTYRALVTKGVPPAEALAASQNPDIMKAVAAKYFEAKPRVPHKLGTDMMGNDIMGSFDPNTGRFYDAVNNPIGGGAAGDKAKIPGTNENVLAKGVKEYNSDLPAEEYMAQFSPEVQAAMRAYIRGDTMPTSNPRLKALATKVKEWSATYGDKAGIPVSDATFSEKRKFRTELGSTAPSTVGGQAKAFNQGMEHADKLATKLEELKNVDPIGIPAVAAGINWMRQAFSTKQTGIAKEAAAIGQTLAGEVGKLFSGSAGGGVHERELTRQRFNTITSPAELAGALEATIETMEGGLSALEKRRNDVMGPNSGIELVDKDTHQRIARIREVIQRLRGEAEPAAQSAPAALQPGQATTINGVTIKRLN